MGGLGMLPPARTPDWACQGGPYRACVQRHRAAGSRGLQVFDWGSGRGRGKTGKSSINLAQDLDIHLKTTESRGETQVFFRNDYSASQEAGTPARAGHPG